MHEQKQNEDYFFQILPQLDQQEMMKLQNQHLERLKAFYGQTKKYAIENWYDTLKQFTFRSAQFPLTAIQAYYLTIIYSGDTEKLHFSKIQTIKQRLKSKVQHFLSKNFPKGCFMKLSTRSPKDFGWDFRKQQDQKKEASKMLNFVTEYYQKNNSAIPNVITKELINQMYRYFLEASKNKFKIQAGEDFETIFSHSERIIIDLGDLAQLKDRIFKQFSEGNFQREDQQLISVWGRQWYQCSWMEEFRCFYSKGKLTGICQYDQRCFFKQIQTKEPIIRQKIENLFNKMLSALHELEMTEGVMDVIVRNNLDQDALLIQINIFNHNTRASLFSWDKDEEVLKNGPLEFRILKNPINISKYQLQKMMGMIEKGTEVVLEKVFNKLGLASQWEKFEI